ncbi:MAG TPA: hypothetical protein VEZ11_08135 [Thermoanaerobaculia bacterium]|nr:hypothetical protein [Thermoanaerobaculia bacterium]
MDPRDIRKWAEDQEAVAARQLAEMRRNPLTPAQSFRYAMDLLVFDEMMNGSPFGRYDPVEEAEVQQVRETWAKLRARWPRGG